MRVEDLKIVLYAQDNSWVAEIPSIAGCYALMSTPEEALRELSDVFQMILDERRSAIC